MTDSRSLSITESGTLHVEIPVRHQSLVFDLCSDMFTFSVTVGPYEQCFRVFGLLADVLRDSLLVLREVLAFGSSKDGVPSGLLPGHLRTSSISSCTGASKRDPGGQDAQPLY